MNIEKPDVSEISLMELQDRPFSLRQDYRIAISNQAYELIYKHAKENTSVEICGVLIGEIFKDANGPYLEITDAIKGEHAENQAGQVMFTHETWSHINNVKDSEFSDKRIVGWYHSHPQFGIFLSSQDMFIHKNFFNQPWQIAFVIDPVSEDEGFFVWYSGNPSRIEQFWLNGYKKVASLSVANSQKEVGKSSAEIENSSTHNKKGLRPLHFFIGLLVITSLLVVNFIRTNSNFHQLLTSLKQYSALNNVPKTEEIKKRLSQNKLLSDLNIKIVQKGNHIWCSGEVFTWHQQELISKTVSSVAGVESVDLQGIVVTHQYITVPGESLSNLAAKLYGNPNRWKDIFQVNQERIKDPDRIQPHVKLSLPE